MHLLNRLARRLVHVSLLSLWMVVSADPLAAGIILSSLNASYSQDFDTLASSGTSSLLPDSWFIAESGSSANTTYAAGTGSSTTGNTYSFGAAGSSERSLGGLASGSLTPSFGVQFLVSGTDQLTDLAVSYTGEQWRLGSTGREDRLDFQYSTDASSLTTGSWTDFSLLDFVAPVTTAPTGALDGNSVSNQLFVAATLNGLNLGDGASLWLRWTDINASGSDDGLSVDDFAVTASFSSAAVPEPSSLLLSAGAVAVVLLRRMRPRRVCSTA